VTEALPKPRRKTNGKAPTPAAKPNGKHEAAKATAGKAEAKAATTDVDQPSTQVRKKSYRFNQGSHVELGKALLYHLEAIDDGKLKAAVFDEGSLHAYDVARGVWGRIDEVHAGKIIQGLDGAPAGGRNLKLKESDIRGALSCARREANIDGFFASAPAGLTFRNKLIQATKDGGVEQRPLSPDNRARFAYDFDYVDDDPVRFLGALRGMFRPDADAEAKIQLVTEFAGVCLLGAATRLQRWVLLKGGGDDGKSTLVDMLRAAMPEGATCSIKPEKLEDEYDRADLAGKLLNTVTEVKQREVLDSETLKAVTAGDQMRGRRIRESPIDFKPRAGHLFAANGYPKFSDSSHGFWRRPIVVTFNRRFTDDPEKEVGLAEVVITAERQRIVCFLVRAGSRAIARGWYLEPKSHAAAIREWRGETDAVYEFVEDCLIRVEGKPSGMNGWTEPTVLHKAFLIWANETGHREMSSTAFGRRLGELGYAEHRTKHARLRPLRVRRQGEVKRDDGSSASN
jgi:P4 family phage/plasmid primase-like protien